MFISRAEAERKFKISAERLRQLEQEGKLKGYDPSRVGYEKPKKGPRCGPRVKVVYDEAHVAAYVGKTGADARFARKQRRDARVFEMLKEGMDVPTIVMELRLDLAVVKHLRDEYAELKGGFLVPGEVRRIAREAGYEIGPDNLVDVLVQLLRAGRNCEPPKRPRVIVVPDE
ncbi:MAG: hypothetical protein IPM54_11320 [Polyangiaceae bacterium]|nr:hypothetical protein [Polyangiaceae bacterium]